MALGQIGLATEEAVAALEEARKDENEGVRRLAAEALESIDPEAWKEAA